MSDRKARLSRRHFLLALGGGAAAAATVAASGGTLERLPAPATAKARRALGYRETAHIARYYRSTRI